MAVSLESLPEGVRVACERLRTELAEALGKDLVALWVYGAVTAADRPRGLGDVDTYGVLRDPVTAEVIRIIDDTHDSISEHHRIEWDSWYILQDKVAAPAPPPHALRERAIDRAWALHRAHWLAGQFVLLHGPSPVGLVQPPQWQDLEMSLESEMLFVKSIVESEASGPDDAAYAIWQSCRILYSVNTRDVVVSKRAAARWALQHMPSSHHPAILAAERAYDGQLKSGDVDLLLQSFRPFHAEVESAVKGSGGSAHC